MLYKHFWSFFILKILLPRNFFQKNMTWKTGWELIYTGLLSHLGIQTWKTIMIMTITPTMWMMTVMKTTDEKRETNDFSCWCNLTAPVLTKAASSFPTVFAGFCTASSLPLATFRKDCESPCFIRLSRFFYVENKIYPIE